MSRDELVDALRSFLQGARAAADFPAAVMDPAGLRLAQALARVAGPVDADAVHLAATLHWLRYLVMPQGDRADFNAAVDLFARLMHLDEQRVPAELRSAIRTATGGRSPDDAARWNNRAADLMDDARRTGDIAVLDQAIGLLLRAVGATPRKHANRGLYLSNLAASLQRRFGHTADLAELAQAIDVGRQAVDATPIGHPDLAGRLSNVSLALQARFERRGDLADLDQAVEAGRRAVEAIPAGDPDTAVILSNLVGALVVRFGRTGALTDLDQAIIVGRRALDASPTGHPDRIAALSNLSAALLTRFERTGALDDLDQAVIGSTEAAEALPAGHHDRAAVLSVLGNALQRRHVRTGAPADLDRAIDAGRQAVASTPTGHQSRAMYLSNLGAALRVRAALTGDLRDADQAVAIGRQAVDETPADHPERVARWSNLSNALHDRYERTGAVADLDHAVTAVQQAVDATPADHPLRGLVLSNLGNALRLRFERSGRQADIDRAITAGRRAIDATPVDHPDRAPFLSNLGNALRIRFERIGELTDIDEAADAFRLAIDATPADHPDRGGRVSGLCGALLNRYDRTGALTDLDQAIAAGRQAVIAGPADHPDHPMRLSNLGNALYSRFERTGDRADQTSAVTTFAEAAAVETAPPLIRAEVGRRWAALAAAAGDLASARDAVGVVLRVLPQLVDHALDEGDRRHHLAQLQGFGALAAWSHLDHGPARSDVQHADAAWSALEAGRGVLLSQALDSRDDLAALERDHPEAAAQVWRLRRLLNRDAVGARPEPATQAAVDQVIRDRRELGAAWAELVADVRSLPGHERFGLPPSAEQLHTAAGEGTIVAIIVTTFGCGALTLTNGTSGYLPMPALTADDIVHRVSSFLQAMHPADGRPADTVVVSQTLEWLWDTVAGPVLEHLGHTARPADGVDWPRVWWLPTSLLSLLPVHAAGYHHDPPHVRRTVLDRVISSYTPTVRALLQARRRPPRDAADGALIVGLNTTARPDGRPLSRAEAEAERVHARLGPPTAPLVGAAATKEAVARALPDARWVHFACHGVVDFDDPGRSYLMLHDGDFTVSELRRHELPNAYLAYLSACSTATGSTRLPDEPIHLAAAFQLAGYAHTIATLWPISDALALRVATDVYQRLAAGVTPAVALHDAVRAVRDRVPDQPHLWASYIHFGP